MEKSVHRIYKEKCDFCGQWCSKHRCFFDENSKALCICKKCEEDKKHLKKIEMLKLDIG